jgi:hypothetical protein
MNLVLPGPKKIQWVDVFALALAVAGSVSSVSLYFDLFHPRSVIGVSVVLTGVILGLTTKMGSAPDSHRREGFSAIQLLIAAFIGGLSLLFRWGPYRFEQGGQDQGLYVNMATTLSRWGSVRFPDAFRQSLDAGAQAIYDQTRLASYYLVDSSKSLMTIEFYPLHPALMALAQSVFGGLGHESLTIISMLGVLGAWYLAIEIDGRRSVATLFALLFAINPAFSFFAKFPVTESVALTFVVFGMLYLMRFLRAADTPRENLYLLISLLSFNSLFYVRWQFLLYIPFFVMVFAGIFLIPSYRKLRSRVTKFSVGVFSLFVLSMVYYMRKQPELYAPVRDALVDMLPSSSPVVFLLGIAATCMFGLIIFKFVTSDKNTLANKFQSRLTFVRISPFVLPLAMLFAIPSVMSLYAGESMYPWGYRVPADVDSWVIRYHAGYRLALFTSPILFLVVLFGGLKKPVRNNATGLVYLFVAVCFLGILMRPTVPYLYYYGRYLIVDTLPGFLLLGAILLVNWITSHRLALRITAVGLTMAIVSYSLVFSSILIGKHEGEAGGFYSAIAKEVNNKDILIISAVSQQVMVPLRARYELNVFAVPDSSSGFSSQDVFNVFGPIAAKQGGRLLYLVPNESAPSNMSFVSEYTFTDNFFTNTDHFRGDGLLYLESKRRLLLPTRWQSASVTWQLFQINLGPLLQR